MITGECPSVCSPDVPVNVVRNWAVGCGAAGCGLWAVGYGL